jgi:hypothetical protein
VHESVELFLSVDTRWRIPRVRRRGDCGETATLLWAGAMYKSESGAKGLALALGRTGFVTRQLLGRSISRTETSGQCSGFRARRESRTPGG